MKFNLRQATWVFVISIGLLATPGFARGPQPQDNRQGQDDRHDNDRHDNDRHDDHDRDHDRDRVPDGGYRQTCRDIHVAGDALQASCQKRNGKWRNTSLRDFRRCSSSIENDNGKLVCNR